MVSDEEFAPKALGLLRCLGSASENAQEELQLAYDTFQAVHLNNRFGAESMVASRHPDATFDEL